MKIFIRSLLLALGLALSLPTLSQPYVGSYPNANALTGTERLLGTQGTPTVNITPLQIAQYITLTNSGKFPSLVSGDCLSNNGSSLQWVACGGGGGNIPLYSGSFTVADCVNVGVSSPVTFTDAGSPCGSGGGGGGSGTVSNGSAGQFAGYTATGTTVAGVTLSGDCVLTGGIFAITCTQTNGVAFGTFATANAATPPVIGGTTPAGASFTSLVITGVSGSTQCLHVNSVGVLSGTGADCAPGTINSGTAGDLSYYATTGSTLSQLGLGQGFAVSSATLLPVYAINAQTTTSYTVTTNDCSKLITFSNAGAIAVTLPAATGSFSGCSFDAQNLGAGTVTITPTGTINGAASLAIGTNMGCSITSDGTNYQVSACTAVLGTFANQNYATPPAIGGTTPAAGAFTTLSATGNLTTNVTGSTQCLQANSSGVVAGTGGTCGGSGGTTKQSVMVRSNITINQNTTEYCVQALCGATQGTYNLTPISGSFKNLILNVNSAPAAGQTFTATVYSGVYDSMTATTLTCTISNPSTTCSDSTHNPTVTAGQAWAVQIVTSATSGNATNLAAAFEYDNP